MDWNAVWLIILATVIVADVVLAGVLISARAQIAEFSPPRDTIQIATDNETKDSNDDNDNNGGSVGINPLLPPTTNMTPPLRTFVMPNGSLALVNTTSGELINVTTIPESTLQLTPTQTGEKLEENSNLGSGNGGGGGGGQERGSTEPPQQQRQEPIRDPNELSTSREEDSPENQLPLPQ